MERFESQNSPGQEQDPIQGEGDYRAAREYREDVREYLEHADVTKAARDAAPRNSREARELERAEAAGRARARAGSAQEAWRDAGSSAGRLRAGARGVGRAVEQRPLTAIVAVGLLGYALGWAARRRPRGEA
ncbi:MAG: hypothetical protein JO184_06650 [Gammaproteobacteria bacterium]|nr:hypothetical protein [Gammaproteobacteria bacterium]MBV8405665.1 hypothetical protein [Gammaproteobacteria bacterium]